MGKLALAAGRGSEFAKGRALVAVDGRASAALFERLGETVLLYLHVDGVVLDFVGQGRVAAVGLRAGPERTVTIEPYVAFAVPVSGEPERGMPGARRMLELEDARFDAILGLSRGVPALDVAEASTALSGATEATYVAIRDQVLRNWRHRCAFTGTEHTADAPLSIVAIRPRDRGGPLHVGNYLPMAAGLERAWRLGHFSVGADYRVLGDLYRLSPEEQDSMVALFRMLLPEEPRANPDAELLGWHRDTVFGRS